MSGAHDDGLEPLLDADRVAELLGVSRAALYKRGIDGLEPVRIGRRVRFRRRDVERVMNGEAARPDDDPSVRALVDDLAEATVEVLREILSPDDVDRALSLMSEAWKPIIGAED